MAPEQAREAARQPARPATCSRSAPRCCTPRPGTRRTRARRRCDVLVRLATEPPDLTGLPPELADPLAGCLDRDPRPAADAGRSCWPGSRRPATSGWRRGAVAARSGGGADRGPPAPAAAGRAGGGAAEPHPSLPGGADADGTVGSGLGRHPSLPPEFPHPQPATHQPLRYGSAPGEPAPSQPSAGSPGAGQPGAGQPGASLPGAGKPAAGGGAPGSGRTRTTSRTGRRGRTAPSSPIRAAAPTAASPSCWPAWSRSSSPAVAWRSAPGSAAAAAAAAPRPSSSPPLRRGGPRPAATIRHRRSPARTTSRKGRRRWPRTSRSAIPARPSSCTGAAGGQAPW